MQTRRPRSLSNTDAVVLSAICLNIIVLLALPMRVAGAPSLVVFAVNSVSDVVGANPGNGICETAPGNHTCTLRRAIIEANHTPTTTGPVLIQLPAGIYTLTIPASFNDEASGDLNLTRDMDLIGSGASTTFIDANGSMTGSRALHTTAKVTISGVTIQNGRDIGLTDCEGKSGGGGICNYGDLTLYQVSVIGNSTQGSGGGIFNQYKLFTPISLKLIQSSIVGNRSDSEGGGIRNDSLSLTVINSTISGNQAKTHGGGIFNAGYANLYNATLTNNQADSDFDGSGTGGGVYNQSNASVAFQNSIVALNWESTQVGQVWLPTEGDCAGTLTSNGNNILFTNNCTINGGVTFADPKLGPLNNNGGATLTHALLAGSPAIDAGNPGGCNDDVGVTLAADQRGFRRPVYGGVALRCDIGAFEYYRAMLALPLVVQ
jgi:CSLREA domain-containing protein